MFSAHILLLTSSAGGLLWIEHTADIVWHVTVILLLFADRPVTLVVAKCWDPAPKSYLSPRQEPVRPIDPSAWVAHTEAVRAMYGRLGPPPSVAGIPAINAPTFMASVPESSCKCLC